MTNQPIPIEQANEMIQLYISLIRTHNLGNQTQSVSFTSKELVPWFNEVMPFADELRIFEGVYPPRHEYAGKISFILWPYKDGKPANWPNIEGKAGDPGGPIKPFNDGSGTP